MANVNVMRLTLLWETGLQGNGPLEDSIAAGITAPHGRADADDGALLPSGYHSFALGTKWILSKNRPVHRHCALRRGRRAEQPGTHQGGRLCGAGVKQ